MSYMSLIIVKLACSDYVDAIGMFLFVFCFGTACGAIMFAVANFSFMPGQAVQANAQSLILICLWYAVATHTIIY
jgi:hypothetical protein